MGDIVVGQELLLGYLMNVLDVDEVAEVEKELARQPKLRSELAKLQKQISPLDILFESVDPPADLAQRTCDNIWAIVQDKSVADDQHIFPIAESHTQTNINIAIKKSHPKTPPKIVQSNSQLTTLTTNPELPKPKNANYDDIESENIDVQDKNSVYQELVHVNSDLDHSVVVNNNCNDNVVATARLNHRRHKQHASEKQTPTKKNIILQQFVISAVIGIMIAIIIYPAVNYLIGRVTQLVVRQKVQQLNDNIEVYAQLSGSHTQTLPDEINLTQYGWQELILSPNNTLANNNNQQFNVTKIPNNEKLFSSVYDLISVNSANQFSQYETINVTNSDLRDYLFLGQSEQSPISLLPNETKNATDETSNRIFNFANEHNLISNLPQSILVLEGSQIRPAVGQNILIQNGRLFFRVLPQSSHPKNDTKK